MRFVGREDDLRILEREYENRGSFVVIYGRRRVGKTTLISEFIRNKKSIYFSAGTLPDAENMRKFSDSVADHLNLKDTSFKSWEAAFGSIADRNEKTVVVLDEFQYLAQANPGFPSIMQGVWDRILKDRGVMLIICGSFMGMMEKYALNHSSPLYGRRTANIKLGPLNFRDVKEAFPGIGFRALMELYAVTGGIPRYLELFDGNASFRENVRRLILDRRGALHEEPLFLLGSEIREPINYVSILEAIALGNSKMSAITGRLGVPSSSVSPYLRTLEDMELVRRAVPATESNPLRSKSGSYKISDGLTAFWFRFVHPYRNYLDIGSIGEVERILDEHLIDGFVSFAFEELCRTMTYLLCGDIGISFTKVGAYWDRNTEIDVVAVDARNKRIFAAECKYSANKVTLSVYNDLKEKCSRVGAFDGYEVRLGLFSVSGFDENLIRKAEEDGSLLIRADEVF
ncbi:MAG: ATP-binding protein [Candidatus Methanoplasma sp.]|jgi:AAA+ ATPase superfamily predicted ATPase|nr:ATP-binding protein [Candidatus Methanoplasma sp.]